MSARTLASLAVAVFVALIAVLIMRGMIGHKGGLQNPAAPGAPVVVAATPIERGAALKPSMLKVVNYPAEAIPTGAYRTVAEAAAGGSRTALRPLALNEPLLPGKISGSGAKTTLSGILAPGLRAVSVKSDDVAGVGGFVLPGDRVDVLLTRTVNTGSGQNASTTTTTQVLAENVRVLGVDQTSDVESDKPVVAKAVTVEVTPDQAQAISLGHAVGSISLALRQVADQGPLSRKVMTVSDLNRNGAPAAPHAARRRAHASGPQVHVTRGTETTGYSAS